MSICFFKTLMNVLLIMVDVKIFASIALEVFIVNAVMVMYWIIMEEHVQV